MPQIIKKSRDGTVFLRLDYRSKKGYYRILESSSQSKHCRNIILEGFERLPVGFYTNDGYGLTAAGNFLLQELHDKFGKEVELTVASSGRSRLDGRGRKTRLCHGDLVRLNTAVRTVKRKRNEEVRAEVQNFLSGQFRQFRDYKGTRPGYAGGTIAEALRSEGVTARLSEEDRAALEAFIPDYLAKVPGTIRAKSKLKVIYDSIDAGRKVYLQKVLKEFRLKLQRRIQNEGIWQSFLSEHILVLRNTYGEVLEKESVSLQGKFPDFMLIDPYSYIDIYEIKKPTTTLLRHDRSRDNFYWDAELSKAISQVENYLHQIQRNSDTLVNDIRRNKGLDINIVRPRAYIIAGMREQLSSPKMRDDFRILNESLKNIDVILYDDLVENLETFVSRVGAIASGHQAKKTGARQRPPTRP